MGSDDSQAIQVEIDLDRLFQVETASDQDVEAVEQGGDLSPTEHDLGAAPQSEREAQPAVEVQLGEVVFAQGLTVPHVSEQLQRYVDDAGGNGAMTVDQFGIDTGKQRKIQVLVACLDEDFAFGIDAVEGPAWRMKEHDSLVLNELNDQDIWEAATNRGLGDPGMFGHLVDDGPEVQEQQWVSFLHVGEVANGHLGGVMIALDVDSPDSGGVRIAARRPRKCQSTKEADQADLREASKGPRSRTGFWSRHLLLSAPTEGLNFRFCETVVPTCRSS